MLEGLSSGERLSRAAFEDLKLRAARYAYKWNLSDDGRERLCDFPLLLEPSLYQELTAWALALNAEAEQAERELISRPALQGRLGIPRALRRALARAAPQAGLRSARFDFHPTQGDTFAITEGNFDVAAGWNEAGTVSAAFAKHVPESKTAGNPAELLASKLRERLTAGQTVGLMHLTRYADDHQVARYLASAFEQSGLRVVFFDPAQLRAAGDQAGALVGERVQPLDAVFRFFPAEWACRLERSSDWFVAAALPGTLWLNPLSTVLTQSKRFPLTWPELETPLPTWLRLLPETRGPLRALGRGWVVKPALGHEGYRVGIAGATEPSALRSLWRSARLCSWRWVAQRQFEACAIETPTGPRFPCVGVYVVDGQAVGLYGRVSALPRIGDTSQECVVLLRA